MDARAARNFEILLFNHSAKTLAKNILIYVDKKADATAFTPFFLYFPQIHVRYRYTSVQNTPNYLYSVGRVFHFRANVLGCDDER